MGDLKLEISEKYWPMKEPFEISRGVQNNQQSILVCVEDKEGFVGRGEGCGVEYEGETPRTMLAQIEGVRTQIESDISRSDLIGLMPAGGARCAVDAALWDLEAKRKGKSVYELIGAENPGPVNTTYTIGMRSVEAYEKAAQSLAAYEFIKIKVAGDNALAGVAAVHKGAPNSKFIVDPNQSWNLEQITQYADPLKNMNVVLLEQPLKVGDEAALDGVDLPIQLCADELINTKDDLNKAIGRFDVINIKLDKTGGLTAAWDLADAASAMGFDLMVGCMAGSSLSMAPAHVLAQRCAYVDLDGPLLQSEDWENGLVYRDGVVSPPLRSFWG